MSRAIQLAFLRLETQVPDDGGPLVAILELSDEQLEAAYWLLETATGRSACEHGSSGTGEAA